MSKVGVRLKINVKQIEKARLFHGSKGTYLDATAFIDLDEAGQYGDHGMITQDVKKEEREAGTKGPILGNVTVFFREDQQQQTPQQQSPAPQPQQGGWGGSPGGAMDDDSGIPF